MGIWHNIRVGEKVCFVGTRCHTDRPGRLSLSSASWAFKPNEDILVPLRRAELYQGSSKAAVI